MKNTSLSGLLRGVQSRHDDCGISWGSHKILDSKPSHTISVHFDVEHFGKQMQRCLDGVAAAIRSIPELRSDSHIVKWGSPPYQYRNPRIDGPVVDQDEMDQRKEWLDIIARESERLQND